MLLAENFSFVGEWSRAKNRSLHGGFIMSKTIGSLMVMIIAAILGFFLGIPLGSGIGGAILLSLIAGIACIVYAIEKASKSK